MQKAVIYCRVSSIKQSSEGHGLDSQEFRCQEYAKRKGYEVEKKVFKDSFSGAGDFMDRPGMVALLSFLDKNPAANYIVIFDDLKRLARDTVFYLKLRREFDARGAKVECPNFTFEETPEGQFIETILAAQGELERKQNQRQVIQKMKARLEKGYWPFRALVGYRMIKDPIHGKILKRFEPEASIIKEALEGFGNGRFENKVDVQKFLQLKQLCGGRIINLCSVKDYLNMAPIYAGYIEYSKWNVARRNGYHEPLIDTPYLNRIEEKLKGKKRTYLRKDNSLDFPLRGFVLCSECLTPITGSWTTGGGGKNKKKHPYYHCKNKKCPMKWKIIKRQVIEDEFEKILKSVNPKEGTLELTKKILLDVWSKRMADAENIKKQNDKALNEIRAKIRMFVDRIGKTQNETVIKAYEREIEKLTEEEKVLEQKFQQMEGGSKAQFETALEETFTFLKNPYLYWKKEDLASKHLVLKLVFSDNLVYKRGEGFGTAKLSLPLRVFELSELGNCSIVDPSGFEPLTSSLQMRRSTN